VIGWDELLLLLLLVGHNEGLLLAPHVLLLASGCEACVSTTAHQH